MIGTRRYVLQALLVLALAPRWSLGQADMMGLMRETHRFRQIFDLQGSKPLTNERQLLDDPTGTVLVILGDTKILRKLSIRDYIVRGGSLLVATDRSLVDDQLAIFGVTLYGVVDRNQFVRVPADLGYQGNSDCPFVIPTRAGPPLFHVGNEWLDKVATNRSGYLASQDSALTVIARFPPEAKYEPPVSARDPEGLPFAMAGEFTSGGRALIMADHSVFINAMLVQSDNQNRDFAIKCVEWLTESGRRQNVLFYNEGRVQTHFDVPMKLPGDLPLPSPEALVSFFDQVMAGLEKENRFNNLIQAPLEGMRRERAITMTILTASFLMALFGLQRLNAARHRREAGTAPVAATVRELELDRPIHELRTSALSAQGNYWEAAHELAIHIFEPLLAHATADSRIQVTGSGNTLENWRWRRRVRALWRLAVDPKPRPWSRRQWLHLHGLIGTLSREISAGRISLTSPTARST